MPNDQLENVLDQVITLTSEKDSSGLEVTLAKTLFALANIKNVVIYSARNISRVKYARANNEEIPEDELIPQALIEDLLACLESAKIRHIQPEVKRLTLFPLMCSKVQPLAVIVLEETDVGSHDLAIQILKIYHNFVALMNENERDTLTGLLNRKTFDQKVNNIITNIQNNQHRRKDDHNEPAYLAIFDIDHFKKVNDTHGHLIGDEVLLLFSRLMDQNFRDKDLLFRFGGEEFVGIFECPSDIDMLNVLNRFRKVIADYNFPQVGKVTVSSGFTKIAEHDLSSKVIDRADVALYHAKNSGRNQVYQHENLVDIGTVSEEKNNSSGDIELF